MCALIIGYVQQLMVEQYKMVRVGIPEDEKGPKCDIFITPDFYSNTTKCLVLI